jgi:hypothetical protein
MAQVIDFPESESGPSFYYGQLEKLIMSVLPSDPHAHRQEEDRQRAQARMQNGYTGDACTACGNFNMRRSGTCLLCDVCGTTTGCS